MKLELINLSSREGSLRFYLCDIFLFSHHHQPFLKVDTSILIGVNGFAEVDGITKLLFQHWLAGVAWKFEEEKASVGLGEVVVRRMVFV